MKISTFLPPIAAALICGTIIFAQIGRNRSLDQRLSPLSSNASTATTNDVSSNRAATLPRDSAKSSTSSENVKTREFEERVARATKEMKEIVAGIGESQESLAGFFGALPGVIKVIAELDIDEAIAVADRLGSSGPLFPPADGNATARLMIYLLVAEQDPLKILKRKDLKLDSPMGGVQVSILGRLAMRDPDAAMRWLDTQSIGDGPKIAYQRNIALGLLANDPRRGLDYFLENPAAFPLRGVGQIVADIPISDAAKADLIQALPDPRYAEFRPALTKVLMRGSLATASVADLRQQANALQLSTDEVANFLRENPSALLQRDPAVATDWMKKALPAEDYSKTVATAIRQWTEQDFNAAATFLASMELSSTRDQSIKEFTSVLATMEPPSAAKWALEIQDPTLRQSALREVGEIWFRLEPAAARQWMKTHGIAEPSSAQPQSESP